MVSDLCIGPTAALMDQQSLLKINLFFASDDSWEESEPANSRDSCTNIFLKIRCYLKYNASWVEF